MKKILPVSLLCLLCFLIPAYSQEKPETIGLRSQLPPLLAAQKYDDAVRIAGQIADLEKSAAPNGAGYVSALQDLARLKAQRLELARAKMKTGITDFMHELTETRDLFAEVVKLAGKTSDLLQLAGAQYESASFRYLFGSASPEVETLLEQSLATREKLLQPGDDLLLLTLDKLSEVYFSRGEFEKFLPVNRRDIEMTEKKLGTSHARLVAPLALYATFLVLTDQGADSVKIAQRVTDITGKPFAPVLNDAILSRGVSQLDVIFGRPVPAAFGGGLIATPDPTNIRSLRGIFNPIPGDNGLPLLNVRNDVMGLALNEQTPDPRKIRQMNIPVTVLVDETGAVQKVEPETTNAKLAGKIRARVIKWKFKPFVNEGAAAKMRGRFWVTCYN